MRRIAITAGRITLEQGESGFAHALQELAARAAALARDGVEAVLVREKTLPAEALARLVAAVMAAARPRGMKVLVAGPHTLAVAAETGADGVHLGAVARLETARSQVADSFALRPDMFVTISCHDLADVENARTLGVSAILFAPVFGKWVDGREVVSGVGLGMLRQACVAAGEMPVFALGGVTQTNAPDCTGAGAAGIAAIRMFAGAGSGGHS